MKMTWLTPIKLGQCGSGIPSISQMNYTVFIAFKANDTSNSILLTTTNGTNGWSSDINIGQSTSLSPSMVTVVGKSDPGFPTQELYIAYRSNSSDEIMLTSSTNGTNWSAAIPTGLHTSSSPSLAVNGQTIYMAFKDSSSNSISVYQSTNFGTSWTALTNPDQKTNANPVISFQNETLYMVFKASNTTGAILSCSYNPNSQSWSKQYAVDGQISKSNPTLISYDNNLLTTFLDKNGSTLITFQSTDGVTWTKTSNQIGAEGNQVAGLGLGFPSAYYNPKDLNDYSVYAVFVAANTTGDILYTTGTSS